MKRVVQSLILLVSIVVFSVVSQGNDPPHNEDSGIGCVECHGEAIFMTSPASLPPEQLTEAYNDMCLRCHTSGAGSYDANTGPLVKNHDRTATASSHDWLGGTPRCTTCHQPHYQTGQFLQGMDDYPADFFLAKGTAVSVTPDTSDPDRPRTTIIYNTLSLKAGWTADDLDEKTGQGRGAIFLRRRTVITTGI